MNESNNSTATTLKNCWDCTYQQIGGDTFLGKCTWFSKQKGEKDKDIPPKTVDVGCKYFVQRGV
ncbi:MAG: hypothetical protein GX642_07635 [Smithella sp.]|jgi:hypothetical protein|nr:hypothetical protein [Smithella sp.]